MVTNVTLKKFLIILFCLFATFCSGGRGKLEELKVPDWVLDPYSKTIGVDVQNEIAGVGIAQECGDLPTEIAEAEAEARLKIAEQVEVSVVSEANSSIDKSSSKNSTELKKSFSQVVKSAVNVAVVGAVRAAMYKDEGSKTAKSNLYVLMRVNKKEMKEAVKQKLLEKFKDKESRKVIQSLSDDVSVNNSEGENSNTNANISSANVQN